MREHEASAFDNPRDCLLKSGAKKPLHKNTGRD